MSVLKVQQAARTAASMHSTLHTVKPCHLLSVRQRYHKYLYSSLRRFTPTVKTGTVHQHLKIQIFKKKKITTYLLVWTTFHEDKVWEKIQYVFFVYCDFTRMSDLHCAE